MIGGKFNCKHSRTTVGEGATVGWYILISIYSLRETLNHFGNWNIVCVCR